MDFRGFDSNVNLILRGGIARPIGNFPEDLSRAMLVGCNVRMEIGRIGVCEHRQSLGRAFAREFKDVVFEDVVFDNNIVYHT